MQLHLSELFEKYVDECRFAKRLRPDTIRSYSEIFRAFSALMPEVIHASDLSSEMLTVFFKRLETRERKVGKSGVRVGVKASTIRTYGSKLRSFFDWLTTHGHLARNPMSDIRMAHASYEDHRALKREEVQRIIASITTNSTNAFVMRRDLAMVYTFVFCGLRRNELLSLKVSDIDPYDKMMTVQAETSKSKRMRRLHIHPTLWLHLSQYLKERNAKKLITPYLWIGNGTEKPFTSHGLKHWVAKVARLSGVKFHVHRFRHTFATNLGYGGTSILKIHKLMGHSQIAMTMTYLRSIQTENLSADIEKLSIENLA